MEGGGLLRHLGCGLRREGRFDVAVKWQKKALEDKEFEKQFGEEGQKRLKLYEAKKPYREE